MIDLLAQLVPPKAGVPLLRCSELGGWRGAAAAPQSRGGSGNRCDHGHGEMGARGLRSLPARAAGLSPS